MEFTDISSKSKKFVGKTTDTLALSAVLSYENDSSCTIFKKRRSQTCAKQM